MWKVVDCLDEVDETYETYAVTAEVYLHGPSFPQMMIQMVGRIEI